MANRRVVEIARERNLPAEQLVRYFSNLGILLDKENVDEIVAAKAMPGFNEWLKENPATPVRQQQTQSPQAPYSNAEPRNYYFALGSPDDLPRINLEKYRATPARDLGGDIRPHVTLFYTRTVAGAFVNKAVNALNKISKSVQSEGIKTDISESMHIMSKRLMIFGLSINPESRDLVDQIGEFLLRERLRSDRDQTFRLGDSYDQKKGGLHTTFATAPFAKEYADAMIQEMNQYIGKTISWESSYYKEYQERKRSAMSKLSGFSKVGIDVFRARLAAATDEELEDLCNSPSALNEEGVDEFGRPVTARILMWEEGMLRSGAFNDPTIDDESATDIDRQHFELMAKYARERNIPDPEIESPLGPGSELFL